MGSCPLFMAKVFPSHGSNHCQTQISTVILHVTSPLSTLKLSNIIFSDNLQFFSKLIKSLTNFLTLSFSSRN